MIFFRDHQPCAVAVVGWETDMLAIAVVVVVGTSVVDGVAFTGSSGVVVSTKF